MFKLITQQLGAASRLWMLVLVTTLITAQAKADGSPAMGMTVLDNVTGSGPVTVFYPTRSAPTEVKRGPFTLLLARDGQPALGNRRLMVFSHGSGGAPWPMADLARSFVAAGYIVAMPEHEGDNWRDMRLQGPASWKQRPLEVSHAIDTLQHDSRFAPLIDFDRVGVYGTSAGGLTALVLGGGKWSPANFKRYCLANMADDFAACVGMIVQLNGNWADNIKLTLASWVHRLWFGDETLYGHQDPRIKAVLATVPMAVPFDLATLAKPAVPTGLVVAGQDLWLAPQAHVRAVQAACTTCTLVLDLPQAGHGSLFSPWPAELAESLTPMLVDPPGFARADLPMLYKKMVAFFNAQLTPA